MELTNKIPFLMQLVTTLTKNKQHVIYLAGKVSGLPEAEVSQKFSEAKTKLEAYGFKVLSPIDYIANNEDWELAMRKAATLLCMADSIYMLADWEDSPGAKREFEIATEFGLNVMWEQPQQHSKNNLMVN